MTDRSFVDVFEIGGDLIAISDDGAMTGPAKKAVEQGVNVLAQAVSNTAHSHGWWSDGDQPVDRNMGEMIALMHSELSEALEAYREGDDYTTISYEHHCGGQESVTDNRPVCGGIPGKPVGVATEFADVIIRILDTCHTLGIPLVQALLVKHEYNRGRPYRHGGKKC